MSMAAAAAAGDIAVDAAAAAAIEEYGWWRLAPAVLTYLLRRRVLRYFDPRAVQEHT